MGNHRTYCLGHFLYRHLNQDQKGGGAANCWFSVTVCPALCDACTEPMGLTPNPIEMNPVMIAVRLPFLS